VTPVWLIHSLQYLRRQIHCQGRAEHRDNVFPTGRPIFGEHLAHLRNVVCYKEVGAVHRTSSAAEAESYRRTRTIARSHPLLFCYGTPNRSSTLGRACESGLRLTTPPVSENIYGEVIFSAPFWVDAHSMRILAETGLVLDSLSQWTHNGSVGWRSTATCRSLRKR